MKLSLPVHLPWGCVVCDLVVSADVTSVGITDVPPDTVGDGALVGPTVVAPGAVEIEGVGIVVPREDIISTCILVKY